MAINNVTGNTLLNGGSFSPCRVASAGAPLVPATGGLLIVDGVQLISGDRVLCKDEASAVSNGIYAANTGPWVRTTDAAGNTQFFDGMKVTVAQGALNGGQDFICTCTDDPVVVGTSLLTFAAQAAVATALQAATASDSFTIGTGSKTFHIGTGKAFQANQWVIVQETANPANQMLGQVTAYAAGALTVNVTATGGSGTLADWTIVLTNSAAAAGYQPPVGSGNVTGPGSVATAGNAAVYADMTGKVLADGGVLVGAANTITPMMLAAQAAGMGCNMLNGVIVVTASAGALQCAVKTLASGGANDPSAADPVFILFRSATAASGVLSVVEVTAALTLTTPSTEVLGSAGFTTNTPGKLWFVATNNGGTVGLAAINCLSNPGGALSIYPLAGQGIASIVAMGASGSTSAQVFYGKASVANLPYSVIGYATWEAPLVMTAGTWITPSRVDTYRPGMALPGQVVQSAYYPPDSASGAITPSSSANVVKAAFSGNVSQNSTSTISFKRNATTLYTVSQANGNAGVSDALQGAILLDAPATLLSVSYSMAAGATLLNARAILLEEIQA